MVNVNEEICYCSHCGAVNKKSAYTCSSCEKKIHTKYRPFYDFLKKHTRDELKGSITDTLFSALSKYLFSHLYGITLSVTIVAATVLGVLAAQPHIERISEPAATVQQPTQQTEQKEQEVEVQPFTEDELYVFEHLGCNYDSFVDRKRSSGRYWSEDVNYYNSADEMFAENNIPNFNYGGVHEMITNPINMEQPLSGEYPDYMEEYGLNETRKSLPETAVQGADCTTDIAKRMLADGYRVAECDYLLEEKAYEGDTVYRRLVYKIVYVEYEGDWYMAEDRLIEMLE